MITDLLIAGAASFAASALMIMIYAFILQPLRRRPAETFDAPEIRSAAPAEPVHAKADTTAAANEIAEITEPAETAAAPAGYHAVEAPRGVYPEEEKPEDRYLEAETDVTRDTPRRTEPSDYGDISRQLAEAYEAERETLDAAVKPSMPRTRTGKLKKPSMSMKKNELLQTAEALGIDVPEKATKQMILDLIMSAGYDWSN